MCVIGRVLMGDEALTDKLIVAAMEKKMKLEPKDRCKMYGHTFVNGRCQFCRTEESRGT